MAAQNQVPLRLWIHKDLRKELSKPKSNLPKDKILVALKDLRMNPDTAFSPDKHIKQCKDLYKVQISDYRLIYTYESNENGGCLRALTCLHRKEVYKGLNAYKRLVG
jgi:mRNA-degrading endonuclease RelE of RelBE toxin-antitoxin system